MQSDPSLRDPVTVEALVRRVEALERGRRRARGTALVSVAALAVLGLSGFVAQDGEPPQEEPPAGDAPSADEQGADGEGPRGEGPGAAPAPEEPLRELVLTDAKGRRRVWLGTRDGGAAGFGLYDAAGTARAELFLADGGEARLMLNDRHGRPRAYLGVGEGGRPLLRLADDQGRPVLEAGIDPGAATRLRLVDPESGRDVELYVLGEGRPGLALGGRTGIDHASMGLSETDSPGLRLRDARGEVVFERP